MQNFIYHTPTKLYFGKGVIKDLPEALKPYGKKVLLTYGSGSIKKIGLYDKVKSLLKDFIIYELSDIEPNPKYDPSVLKGVEICKQEKIDMVLAVGGGSVLDCSKAICAGAKYEGDPWDLISYKVKAKEALPLFDILTLAATGSEYDSGGVISRVETNDKIGYMDELLFPVASFLDPEYTYSVPAKQIAAGCADAMNHVIEQYFCQESTLLNDGMCESVIQSLMYHTPILLKEPENYTSRAEFMFDCTLGCNGILSLGNSQSGWPCHALEHALSAYYDITHGIGLAILTPNWMRHILNDKTLPRFKKFALNVMKVEDTGTDIEIANKGIDALENYFLSINIPMHLKEVGIDETRLEEMAQHVADTEGLEEAYYPLYKEDILEIYKKSL